HVLAVLWIGTRFGALAILAHDAAHNRLFRHRLANNVVGELCMWVLFINLQNYRSQHLTHHRELNTERDPDWVHLNSLPEYQFPKSGASL
ncbi:fatty acid desaturase, partial [Acinetobacter baumannii]